MELSYEPFGLIQAIAEGDFDHSAQLSIFLPEFGECLNRDRALTFFSLDSNPNDHTAAALRDQRQPTFVGNAQRKREYGLSRDIARALVQSTRASPFLLRCPIKMINHCTATMSSATLARLGPATTLHSRSNPHLPLNLQSCHRRSITGSPREVQLHTLSCLLMTTYAL